MRTVILSLAEELNAVDGECSTSLFLAYTSEQVEVDVHEREHTPRALGRFWAGWCELQHLPLLLAVQINVSHLCRAKISVLRSCFFFHFHFALYRESPPQLVSRPASQPTQAAPHPTPHLHPPSRAPSSPQTRLDSRSPVESLRIARRSDSLREMKARCQLGVSLWNLSILSCLCVLTRLFPVQCTPHSIDERE